MEIETTKSKYTVVKNLGLLVNSELTDDFSTITGPEKNTEKELRELKKNPADEEIVNKLSNCTALVFGITEQCNFRCKYCVYSGSYKNEREHSGKKMSFDTAKKGVDLFLNLLMQDNRQKKRREVYIGFYGGEPLLEFDLIKRIIKYVEESAAKTGFYKKFDIFYRLTTNGYLLNGEKADYLKQEDVLLDVSIDGPGEEHNKFRVTANGQGTWAQIMSNLKNIKNRYPDYYENNMAFLVTIHPHHNCEEIDRFFMDNQDYFPLEKTKFNTVNTDQLKDDEKERLKKNIGSLGKLYIDKTMQLNYEPKFKFAIRQPGSKLTGTCFPGSEKLSVSASGELSVCEKASEKCPKIGNVNTGFDFDGIRELMKDYNEEITRNRCWECDYWFLCGVCIATASYDGKRFDFNCSIEQSFAPGLKKYLEKKECEDDEKYSHCSNRTNNSIIDFIEQL
jgi:uncharacterized protein